jgi:DNA polymerase V
MEKVIAIIDLKSFYASCECSARHLDPFMTPLVCCDPYRGEGTIVMSASPYLKSHYGVPNVCRRKDLPRVKGLIYAVPRMSYYLMMSARVVSIFLDFVAKEDLHVYSVDESFLNLGPYLNLYGCSPEEIVQKIQKRISNELGLVATCGIGPNMILAKLALDNEGKKKPPYIARWDYEDVPTKLWKISPITKIWGIAGGISSHLSRIGIRSVESLAKAPLSLLTKEFGVMGEQLHNLANGIDGSDTEEKYEPVNRGLSEGQTLTRDYSKSEALLLLREMNDDLSRRLRLSGSLASKVSLWLGYSDPYGMVSQERSLLVYTDDTDELFLAIKDIYMREVDELPIRNLSISYGNLKQSEYKQGCLFFDPIAQRKREQLTEALDAIKDFYGPSSVLRCSSLLKASTIKTRHEQIGGHRK